MKFCKRQVEVLILTRQEIENGVQTGSILLKPFNRDQLNPNSYNYRLASGLIWHPNGSKTEDLKIGEQGIVLIPNGYYLGTTIETIGSSKYAMSLIGRSSLGRLGLFLQVSADLGHTGSSHRWTLELRATVPIRVYANMNIGQVSFWHSFGEPFEGNHYYSTSSDPLSGRIER